MLPKVSLGFVSDVKGEGAPAALNLTTGKGGKAGIWQGGMALATDLANNRIFFATG